MFPHTGPLATASIAPIQGPARLLPAQRIFRGAEARFLSQRSPMLARLPKPAMLARLPSMRSRRSHRPEEAEDPGSSPAKAEEERRLVLPPSGKVGASGRNTVRARSSLDHEPFKWVAKHSSRRGLHAIAQQPGKQTQRAAGPGGAGSVIAEQRSHRWSLDGGVYWTLLAGGRVETPGSQWLARLFDSTGVQVPRFDPVISLLGPASSPGKELRPQGPMTQGLRMILAGVGAWSRGSVPLLASSKTFLNGASSLKGGWCEQGRKIHSYAAAPRQLPYGYARSPL